MHYRYMCNDCSTEKLVIFEVEHGMKENPKIACPKCGKTNTQKCMVGLSPTFYVRGNCYLDRTGCRRDMELHTLLTKNPYAEHYQTGERDEIIHKLRTGGKRKERKNKQTLRFCKKCKKWYWTDKDDLICIKCGK